MMIAEAIVPMLRSVFAALSTAIASMSSPEKFAFMSAEKAKKYIKV
jgi:hypothetical protein